jgi:hypothetical protein
LTIPNASTGQMTAKAEEAEMADDERRLPGDRAIDLAAARDAQDTGGAGTGDKADAGGVTPQMAAAGDIASDSDVGRIGGGLTGGISTGSARTGTAGSGIGSGGTGGAEPTDTGYGMGTDDIGTGIGGAEAPGRTSLGNDAGVTSPTEAGLGGSDEGSTSTNGGGGIGALSGGTGDIGGPGGTAASETSTSGGAGTAAVGGIGGGPGTIDEGTLGATDEPAGGA